MIKTILSVLMRIFSTFNLELKIKMDTILFHFTKQPFIICNKKKKRGGGGCKSAFSPAYIALFDITNRSVQTIKKALTSTGK